MTDSMDEFIGTLAETVKAKLTNPKTSKQSIRQFISTAEKHILRYPDELKHRPVYKMIVSTYDIANKRLRELDWARNE